jgi:hypothetical protein
MRDAARYITQYLHLARHLCRRRAACENETAQHSGSRLTASESSSPSRRLPTTAVASAMLR